MALIKYSSAKSGFSSYMETGKKEGDDTGRFERDDVTALEGNLQTFQEYENLSMSMSYTKNYTHTTLTFSPSDMDKLNSMPEPEKVQFLQGLAQELIDHQYKGYNKEDLVKYAEFHEPKDGTPSHIHLAVGLYSPTLDRKIEDLKFSPEVERAFQNKLNLSNGLEIPKPYRTAEQKRENFENRTQFTGKRAGRILQREDFSNFAKNFNDINDYVLALSERLPTAEFREVKTNKNNYIQVKQEHAKRNINLRGKGFEHLYENGSTTSKKDDSTKDFMPETIEQCDKILTPAYEKHTKRLAEKRLAEPRKVERTQAQFEESSRNRTVSVRKPRPEPHKNRKSTNSAYYESVGVSYQNKSFQKDYNSNVPKSLEKAHISTNQDGQKVFKTKDFALIDKGDKINLISNKNSSLEQQANALLDMCLAKGWKPEHIEPNGTKEFVNKFNEIMQERFSTEKQHNIEFMNKIEEIAQKMNNERKQTDFKAQDDQMKRMDLGKFLEMQGFERVKGEKGKYSNGVDTLAVWKNAQGHYMQKNFSTGTKAGTIFDFVKNYKGLEKIKEQKQFIEQYQGLMPEPRPSASAPKKQEQKIDQSDLYRKLKTADTAYLSGQRKLSAETLQKYSAHIRTDKLGYSCFVHTDINNNITGLEQKIDKNYAIEKDIPPARFTAGGERALFKLQNSSDVKNIYVVESALDALSLQELTGYQKDLLVVSTGGTLGDSQIEQIKALQAKYGAKLYASFDSDTPGAEMQNKLCESIPDVTIEQAQDSATGEIYKDYNEQLQQIKKQQEAEAQAQAEAQQYQQYNDYSPNME